jgi:hypothetical protein
MGRFPFHDYFKSLSIMGLMPPQGSILDAD